MPLLLVLQGRVHTKQNNKYLADRKVAKPSKKVEDEGEKNRYVPTPIHKYTRRCRSEYEFDCENRKTVKQNPASTNVNIDQHTIHIADSNVVGA